MQVPVIKFSLFKSFLSYIIAIKKNQKKEVKNKPEIIKMKCSVEKERRNNEGSDKSFILSLF